MSLTPVAELTTVATFPINYFLENLAVRSDNSLLVTVLNHKELWFIPAAQHETPEPIRLCTFDQPAMGIVEVEPDVFVICTSNLWATTSPTCTAWTCVAGSRVGP